MTVAPGTSLGGYRIEVVAGRGGMGVVYRAVQEGLDRPVALKLIAPELARDREFRARFVRESRLAASIDHPHVIPVYEAGEADGALYIAMRWVDGPDLRELVAREGPLPAARAGALIAQVAGALDEAHARGLVHRDVKPANVLLADGDHVYLSDFGLALSEASSDRLTRTGSAIGTASYSSPEQIEGRAVDARSDVYALACVLYFAVTGEPPFRRDTELATAWAQVHEAPPRAPALDEVLQRGLAKDPAKRPASAGELARAALHVADASIGAVAGGADPPDGGSRTRRLDPGGVAPSDDASRTRRLDPGGVAPSDDASRTRRLDAAETVRLARTRRRRRGVLPALLALVGVAAAAGVIAALSLTGDDPEPTAKRLPPITTTERRTTPPPKPVGPVVPDLVGLRLDEAESLLDGRGIEHANEGGGTFGVVVAANWTVCDTDPPVGDPVASQSVTLIVDREC